MVGLLLALVYTFFQFHYREVPLSQAFAVSGHYLFWWYLICAALVTLRALVLGALSIIGISWLPVWMQRRLVLPEVSGIIVASLIISAFMFVVKYSTLAIGATFFQSVVNANGTANGWVIFFTCLFLYVGLFAKLTQKITYSRTTR